LPTSARTTARRSGRRAPSSSGCAVGSNLFTHPIVAIDGSKFKAVNNRDKNYTVTKVSGRMEQVEASIARYLRALDQADREESDVAEAKSGRLKEKIAGLRQQMQALKVMEQMVQAAPDQQVSLTDPDARSMATSGKGTATVGYNVQIAVDAEHHLIVAHEVANQGCDRNHLAPMALRAQQATGCEQITALADRGYFSGDQVLSLVARTQATTRSIVTASRSTADVRMMRSNGHSSNQPHARFSARGTDGVSRRPRPICGG
jgi:hypothetical protein